jgi:ABC-type multidrug transport system fused ATPase/permease subunit
LFNALGAKFEPYVNLLLPHLLLCFGDTDQDVRACTQDAAQVVMSNLTEHGVRMVLPLLLKSLEESNNWRSQIEAVGMLGSMAFCAPKQLSTCLPQLVPRMLQTLTNPHAKVQDAATNALKSVGSVIRNPEVQLLVPQLLAAFTDSAPATLSKALQALADTSFVHAVDAPSLSLIMPILRRSLHARTIQLKKTSAQITGSICSLIGNIKGV